MELRTDFIHKSFSTDKIAQYFRTRSPVCTADIDGWKANEIIAHLFMGDDHEFHALLRDELILPYLFGDFHPSHSASSEKNMDTTMHPQCTAVHHNEGKMHCNAPNADLFHSNA